MKGYSWFKGFRHMLSLQKKDKSLMNNAPWAGYYDRTGKVKKLVNTYQSDIISPKDEQQK